MNPKRPGARRAPRAVSPGRGAIARRWLAAVWIAAAAGCSHPALRPTPPDADLPRWRVLSGPGGGPVSWEEMIAGLRSARVVYIGETHTRPAHHELQLDILRELVSADPAGWSLGLEMFDRSYQPVLDAWSRGELTEGEFLRRTHWYANWRYDFGLYRAVLEFARDRRLPLHGLNIPFHIPPKIRVGGTEHLAAAEKAFLPAEIDLSVEAHRRFAEAVFARHDFRDRVRFEDFYLVQCVWDEAMAETVAGRLGTGRMVVLAGNGHIQYAYGIPERAFRRNGLPFRTVYALSPGEEVPPGIADYVVAER